jgi:uncharacterized membrane protein YtjA (UPF0391 family)
MVALLVLALGLAGVVHGAAGLTSVMFMVALALLGGSALLPRSHRHHAR